MKELRTQSQSCINKLPKDIAGRIAAGEVIENPASVLKELLENSLDAGADEILVELVLGGADYLRVRDNGHGIKEGELPLALSHHATSKINGIDDLLKISTLGFRGEALASIAEVSMLKLQSKPDDAPAGAFIEVEGGEETGQGPCSITRGTDISVRSLFFNLPARRKFLKHPSKELISCKKVVESLALFYHNVSFVMKNGSKTEYDLPKRSSMKERLADYMGREKAEQLILCSGKGEGFSYSAYFSDIDLHQASSRGSQIFINGRSIENKSLSFAVKNAYHGLIPKDRHPYFFLYLDVSPELLDVNVHPSKREVKLKCERQAASAMYNAVKTLFEREEGPSSSFRSIPIYTQESFPRTGTHPQKARSYISERSADKYSIESMKRGAGDFPKPVDERAEEHGAQQAEMKGESQPEESKGFAEESRVIGQLHSSYILVERKNELLILDQHAAYERLNFERVKRKLTSEALHYERLLIPLEIEYPKSDVNTLKNARQKLKKIGIEFELMGDDCIVFDKIPVFLSNAPNEDIVKGLLDRYLSFESGFRFERFLDAAIEDIACKLSPKAGDILTHKDMQELVDALEEEGALSSCPHGRPFILRLERGFIEKKFFRGR